MTVQELQRLLSGRLNPESEPRLNVTAVLELINRLPPVYQQQLLDKLNLGSLDALKRLIDKMHVREFERPFMEYPEYRLSKIILLYVPPILIILGTFGNLFSFIVLRRRAMLKVSTYLYLAALAIADSFVLYIGLLRMWIGELTGIDVQQQASWLCKMTVVLGYSSSDISVWLIIAVTVERYIVVCHPFRANQMCNVPRAKRVIVFLIFLILGINSHFLWTVELKPLGNMNSTTEGNFSKCDAVFPFEVLVQEAWPWVDAIIYSFLPFLVIFFLNILIIRQVLEAHGSREKMQMQAASERRKLEGKRGCVEGSTKLTVMLLTVSFTFLITTLPMNVSLIFTAFYNQNGPYDHEHLSRFKLAKTITEMLMYVNHSVNFFLYCATGQKFRQQVLGLFCRQGSFHSWNSVNDDSPKSLGRTKNDILLTSKVEAGLTSTTDNLMRTRV